VQETGMDRNIFLLYSTVKAYKQDDRNPKQMGLKRQGDQKPNS
jgi:hypothetical protein